MPGRYTKAGALSEEVFRRKAIDRRLLCSVGRAKVCSTKNKSEAMNWSSCGCRSNCCEISYPKLKGVYNAFFGQLIHFR